MKISLLTAVIAVVLASRESCSQSLRASAFIAPRQGVEMGGGVATVQTRTGALDVEVSIANRGASSYVVQVVREGDDALRPSPGSSTLLRGGENREVRFRVAPTPAAAAGQAPQRITYVISPMI